jgi:HlyD family secretion protein
MKKKVMSGIISVILLGALLGVTACSGAGGNGVTRQEVSVARGDLTVSVSGNGNVATPREARLTFGSAGKISKIAVKEGDTVKTGDVLAGLDTRSLELAVQQAQMALTQAEGTLMQAQLAQSTAENSLDNLRNSGDSLKLALINAQIARDQVKINLLAGINAVDSNEAYAELKRAQAWYDYVQSQVQQKTGNEDAWLQTLDTAKESLDAAQMSYDNALAGYNINQANLKKKQLEAAELAVALAQKNIDDLDKNVALQELQVASAAQTVKQAGEAVDLAKQSLADARKQLDEATITAPFDGVIAMVLAREGDVIPSPSMAPTTIIQMVNPDFLELVIEVDEIDIPSVELGQEADVKVDALPDAVFKGSVTALYPVPVEQGGIVLYKLKIDLDVPPGSGIRVGMSASADIVSARHAGVLTIPSRAITTNSQGQTVVKVTAGGKTQERAVVVGLDDGIKAEIVSGLSEGEMVIVEIKTKTSAGSSLFGG